jgi:ABC-2 type transport system permease protein
MANGLRGGGQRVVGTVVAAIYGAILALGGFAVLVVAGTRSRDGPVTAMLVAGVLVVGWAVVPILGFGSDETLDPSRLQLLPLRRRDLMLGLLAASCFGIGPIATLIVLSGAVVGFAPLGFAAVVVALSAIVQLAVCVALARALVTAMSGWLRSRKGRDLRILIVPLLVLAPQLLRFVNLPRHTTLGTLRPLTSAAGWVPALFPMRALVAASHGRLAVAMVELAGGAATVALLCWWWAQSLDRIATIPDAPAARPVDLTSGPTTAAATAAASPAATASPTAAASATTTGATSPTAATTAAAVSAGRPATRDPLFGAALAWLPRTRTGAVAAREFRVNWRDPRRRVQIISTVVFPIFVIVSFLSRGIGHQPGLAYAALLAIGLGGPRVNNQLGMDGPAWWVHEANGSDWRSDLTGKNIGVSLTSLPIAIVLATVLAAVSGGWSQLPAVVTLAVALEEVELAIGNVMSVRAPFGVPESKSNAFASNTGQGCIAGLLMLLSLAVAGLLCAPGIIAVVVVPSGVGRAVIGVVAMACGYLLWRLGLSIAVRVGNRRGPEVLESLGAGAAAR